jgi:hypothetical protein
MGTPTWEVIATILTAVASIFGALLGLLKFYFRQQTKLEIARKEAARANYELLSIDLANVKSDYTEVVTKLDEMIQQFSNQKLAAEKVYLALGEFVVTVREKFKKYDEHQLPEKYNTVEVTEETPANFGKVKVKE